MVMASEALPRGAALAEHRNTARRDERMFFSGMAIALVATVFAGFSRTYYLRGTFGSPELPTLLVVHGFVFTAWMILLVVQTSLVAANNAAVHRRFGVAGAALGVLMTVLGAYVAIMRAGADLLALSTIVVFPTLLGTALLLRKRTDYHKRLVLIATLELVSAAVARLPGVFVPLGGIGPLGPVGLFGITDLFLIAIALYDWRALGRVHPATLWGGLFLIASQPLRLLINATPAWQSFANWLTNWFGA
jgi:phosphoglycerol transferase MdoB-like AlkP superfamily enzyme